VCACVRVFVCVCVCVRACVRVCAVDNSAYHVNCARHVTPVVAACCSMLQCVAVS